METQKETIAQEAKRLLQPIPSKEWTTHAFTDGVGKCCAIGHYQRLKSGDPKNYRYSNCNDDSIEQQGLRRASQKFIKEQHSECSDLACVNNHTKVNGYNEKTPKKRVMKLLDDMIKAGY